MRNVFRPTICTLLPTATLLGLSATLLTGCAGGLEGTRASNAAVDDVAAPESRLVELASISRRTQEAFLAVIDDEVKGGSSRVDQVASGFGAGPPGSGIQPGPPSFTSGPPQPIEFEFGPDTAWWWFDDASEADLVAKIDEGYRLVDIEVLRTEPIRFAAVLVRNSGSYAKDWWWFYDRTEAQLRAEAVALGARPIRVQPYMAGSAVRYATIFVRETGADDTTWLWLPNTSVSEVRQRVYQSGMRIIDIEGYDVGGDHRFSAILDNAITGGPNAVLTHAELAGIGSWLADNPAYQLVDLERQPWGGYVAIAARNPNLRYWWWYLSLTPEDIVHLTGRHYARIVDIDGRPTNSGYRYDIVMTDNGLPQNGVGEQFSARDEYDARLRDFVKRRGIPGLGMALVKDGRLIYAQNYGLARIDPVELATTRTLFRIGSASKITAAIAMIQLIEQGVPTPAGQPISMSTRIFRDVLHGSAGVGDPLSDYNTDLNAITVRHVLQHIAGYPNNYNPITDTATIAVDLGIERTPTCSETVRWMLDKPVPNPPGATYAYFNTGPCIIAAAVEVLSGQSFEDYISQNLFQPYGIHASVVPSADLLEDRAVGEAEHYSTIPDRLSGAEMNTPRYLELVPAWPDGVPDFEDVRVRFPYGGIPLVNGTAPGGIAASAAAYARLLVGVDGSDGSPLIEPTSFTNLLTATSAANPGYGAFVAVNAGNGDVFHNGAVGGGGGWYVMKPADNVIWTAFFNATPGPDDLNELNLLMIAAYNGSQPSIDGADWDLFPSLGIASVDP